MYTSCGTYLTSELTSL